MSLPFQPQFGLRSMNFLKDQRGQWSSCYCVGQLLLAPSDVSSVDNARHPLYVGLGQSQTQNSHTVSSQQTLLQYEHIHSATIRYIRTSAFTSPSSMSS